MKTEVLKQLIADLDEHLSHYNAPAFTERPTFLDQIRHNNRIPKSMLTTVVTHEPLLVQEIHSTIHFRQTIA